LDVASQQQFCAALAPSGCRCPPCLNGGAGDDRLIGGDGLDGLAFGRQRLNSGSSLGISLGSLARYAAPLSVGSDS
jgi:hypothetical protein